MNSVTETSSSASVMEGLKAFNEKQSERLEEENSQLLDENKQLKDNIKALTEQLERLKKEKEELEQSPAVKVARAIEKAGVKFNENLNPEAIIEHLKSFYESIANSKLFNGETKVSFEDFLNNKVKVDFSEKLNSFYDYSLELKNSMLISAPTHSMSRSHQVHRERIDEGPLSVHYGCHLFSSYYRLFTSYFHHHRHLHHESLSAFTRTPSFLFIIIVMIHSFMHFFLFFFFIHTIQSCLHYIPWFCSLLSSSYNVHFHYKYLSVQSKIIMIK